VSAKRDVARGLAQINAVLRLEPLTVAVHERHQRHGNAKQARRQTRDAVKGGFGRGIENVQPLQGFQASGFFNGEK